MSASVQRITPFLWFDKQAGEAARYYTALFPDSMIVSSQQHEATPSGTVEIYQVVLSGQPFTLMSAGPLFAFSEAISFVIGCDSQEEVDFYWHNLTAGGGEEGMCGWLKDRFGVSWQVVPRRLQELMADKDQQRAGSVMQAMLKMKKLNIAQLESACEDR